MKKIENGLGWEDAAALAEGARIQAANIVLTTTGSGDHVLELLRHDPRMILCVDPRPAQTYLLELKLAALKSLLYNDFLEFLGIRESRRRDILFERVHWLLSSEAQAYWEKHLEEIERGIVWQGDLEESFASFRKFVQGAKTSMAAGTFVPQTISARGLTAQDWKQGVEGCTLRNGPYATALFEGQFETLPPAFCQENYEIIKARANRVILVTDSMEEYLPLVPEECVDAVVFTEPAASGENEAQMWRHIFRAGKPGARIVTLRGSDKSLRSLMGQGTILEQDTVDQRSFFGRSHSVYIIAKTGAFVEACD